MATNINNVGYHHFQNYNGVDGKAMEGEFEYANLPETFELKDKDGQTVKTINSNEPINDAELIKNFLRNMGVNDQALLDQAGTAFVGFSYKDILRLLDLDNDGKIEENEKNDNAKKTVDAMVTGDAEADKARADAYKKGSLSTQEGKEVTKEEKAHVDAANLQAVIFEGNKFNEEACKLFLKELGVLGNGEDKEIEMIIKYLSKLYADTKGSEEEKRKAVMNALTGNDDEEDAKFMDAEELNALADTATNDAKPK